MQITVRRLQAFIDPVKIASLGSPGPNVLKPKAEWSPLNHGNTDHSVSIPSRQTPLPRGGLGHRSLEECGASVYGRKLFSFSLLVILQTLAGFTFISHAETRGVTIPRNAAPGVAYVGSAACEGCHASLYQRYRQTGMGRSMSLASDPVQLSRISEPITVFQQNISRHFTIFRQGSDLYQSQYELDASGKEIFRSTHKVEYVVGSGSNGQSYVVRRGESLFQAPLSYYAKPAKFEVSPGFELQDVAFNRPIAAGCVACHSGRANAVRDRVAVYGNPAFHELAIGCENCHGPGQLHIAERSKGAPVSKNGDTSIVNPARLPSWLADNICMNCHQTGGTRVLQPGKHHLDFRPGTPLNDTVGIFRARGETVSGDLLEHYSSMVLSRCYQQTDGKLSCVSCHSPHSEPSPADAPAYYRGKCLSCHTNQSCAMPLPQRLAQTPANHCSRCHMPQRDIGAIAHSALTNHRIPKEPSRPGASPALPVSRTIPDVVHLNEPPGREPVAVPLLTQLQVYGELLPRFPTYQDQYLSVLDQLETAQPRHPLVISALARREKLKSTAEGNAQALKYLLQAVADGSTSVIDYQDLAQLLVQTGRNSEAIPVLEKATALFPFTPLLYKALSLQLIQAKDYDRALQTMKKHLELFPEDTFMRKLVGQAEAASTKR